MKRKDFLKSMVGLPLLGGAILAVEPKESIVNKKVSVDDIKMPDDKQSELLTKHFFEYLNTHPVKFKWARLTKPTEENEGHPIVARTRRVNALISGAEGYAKLPPSTQRWIVVRIVEELEAEYAVVKTANKFYIYQLILTPVIYDPETFEPRKGVMIRYARR